MNYFGLLKAAMPEGLVVLTALAVLSTDLLWMRDLEGRSRRRVGALISGAGLGVACAWMLLWSEPASLLGGMFTVDALTQLVKVSLAILTLATILLAVETGFTEHVGEYLGLLLLCLVGMMCLVSSRDLLMVFVSLEMTSLCLYMLAAFDSRRQESGEAGLKYFLFGGVSAAFTLFGMSWLYGLAGGSSLAQVAARVHAAPMDTLLVGAMVMVLIGLGFKVAAAPFHLWAPDVYQGAPTPSAGFIASGSKVAGFFVLAQVFLAGLPGATGSAAWGASRPGWAPLLALAAAVSMIWGNLAALAQRSVSRLLAYSAIAHAGYMLIGVLAADAKGMVALVYYVITYAVTTLGAFAIVGIVRRQSGGDRLGDFAGLSRRSPVVAWCLMVFLLSLAGIPPLAGFFGKFYLFASALGGGAGSLELLWLVLLGVGFSAVSLYYYLLVLKQAFVADGGREPRTPGQDVPGLEVAVVVILAAAVLFLGLFPGWLAGPIARALL